MRFIYNSFGFLSCLACMAYGILIIDDYTVLGSILMGIGFLGLFGGK